MARGPHGLPGKTIFVDIENFLYLFTGIKFVLRHVEQKLF